MMRCCGKDHGPADYQPLTVSTGTKSRRLVTVEPALACYMLAQGFIIALQTEFVQGWVSRVHNYTLPNNVENGTCSMNESFADSKLQATIQVEATRWLMYLTIANRLPSLFMTVIIGAYSDSVGRRFALLLPSFGQLLNLCVWIITAVYDLPLEYLIGSMFLQGIMGGSALFIASCFTYISDVTMKKNRTTCIIIGECVLVSSGGIAQLCAGYVLDGYNFVVAFAVAAGISGTAILYLAVPFFLPETVVTKGEFISGLKTSLRGILNITVNKSTEYRKTFYIINFIMLTVFMFSISSSIVSLLSIHFLGEPFCFSYLLSGYYTTMLLFIPAIGLLLSALLLKRFMNDFWLLHLSVLSSMLFLTMSALAQTTLLAFVGAGLGIFKSLFAPTSRSIVSKMSSPEEQGAVFGCLGFTESLANFLCPLVLNNIYTATVSSMPTFVFWMCAGICFLPILSIGYLQYTKRIERMKNLECSSTSGPAENDIVSVN